VPLRRRARLLEALAGVVAAGAALATTELIAALAAPHRPGPVASVASRVVDVGAGSLKDLAVDLFSTNDKAALVVGIVVVSLALGAAVGLLAARWWWVAIIAFGGAAVVGVIASARDPQASLLAGTLACIAGAGLGAATLLVLLRLVPAPVTAPAPLPDPRVKQPDRRTFFVVAGGVGLAAAMGTLASRTLRGPSRASSSRAEVKLPAPARTVPLPADQPFTVDGLTPYVTGNDRFYRIDTAVFVPQVDTATWRLQITGRVDRPLTFTYDDLLAMDLVEEAVTLACVSNDVGGSLVGNAVWRGVPLTGLLDRAGVLADASQILARSVDDFTVGLPTAAATDGRTALVALAMNGEPLPIEHGYPARLVVAGLYGYVSATKWLTRLELTRLEDADSFWVERGWARDGPVKLQSRVDVPRSGAAVPRGSVTVAGVAWAPGIGISAVEVQMDEEPWVPAELGRVASIDTWVQWRHAFDLAPGAHVVSVRAIDVHGTVQTDATTPPEPNGASGHHFRGFTVL
jgi:DMSO/TMAO reductase YedYZ molybdopterin-dependent catalytic subunit